MENFNQKIGGINNNSFGISNLINSIENEDINEVINIINFLENNSKAKMFLISSFRPCNQKLLKTKRSIYGNRVYSRKYRCSYDGNPLNIALVVGNTYIINLVSKILDFDKNSYRYVKKGKNSFEVKKYLEECGILEKISIQK